MYSVQSHEETTQGQGKEHLKGGVAGRWPGVHTKLKVMAILTSQTGKAIIQNVLGGVLRRNVSQESAQKCCSRPT